jgi:phosphatidylglycerol:prolipoprotein diacylglycerol transferase
MLPTLPIGPLVIPVPQFSLLLAFWFGLSLAEKLATRRNISAEGLYNLVFTGLVAGLLGARIGYVLQYPSAFIQSPLSLFSLNPGMFDAFSGSAMVLLGMIIYGQRNKLPFWETLDILTPMLAVMAVGLAISHIASGEAFGSETNLPWAINLWGAKRHPSQFYELVAAAIILGLVIIRFKSIISRAGNLFFVFVALTAAARLFLEGFHGDSFTILGGVRIAQILAWIILATGCSALVRINQKT